MPTLGLVSAGYADGVFRAAGSVAEVAVKGRRYLIAGRVCMDQFVIDLGPATEVCVGDLVTHAHLRSGAEIDDELIHAHPTRDEVAPALDRDLRDGPGRTEHAAGYADGVFRAA